MTSFEYCHQGNGTITIATEPYLLVPTKFDRWERPIEDLQQDINVTHLRGQSQSKILKSDIFS
jgi:hypothetical protein